MKLEKQTIFQWDVNQYLDDLIGTHIDFELNDTEKEHFETELDVLQMQVIDGRCKIPDYLLQKNGSQVLYECYADGTMKKFSFYIQPRPLPTDYVYTEDETATFESLTEEVHNLVTESKGLIETMVDGARKVVDGLKKAVDDKLAHVQHLLDTGAFKGEKGDTGDVGPQGPQGDQGIQGLKGDIGPQGPQGVQGPKGDKGDKGDQGVQGIQGPQGVQGLKGAKGDKGDQGEIGPQGPKGEKGDTGDSFVLFPNVTIVGQPTINNGQLSNFSANNYAQFPFIVNFQNQPFELNFEITTGNEVNNQHNVFDSVFGLAFAVRSGKFVVAISTNGSSWNIGEGVGTHTIQPNTTYRVKMTWDLTQFVVSYSVDGGSTYIDDIIKPLTSQPYPKQMLIGITSDKSTVFNGIINLNYATLSIANKVVWQGMDDVGLATRMAVDMSNIDEAGVNKVKEIAKEVAPAFTAQTIIENHIKATPDYGTYTVRFPKWDTSHTSNGEKLDDNQGLVLTPATDTVKEVNTYPHCFDTIDVNAYVDEDGVRHITAIKGDENFKDTGRVDVFVCLRAYWEKTWEEDGYEYYSRCYYPKEGYTINRLAVNRDGTYNNWFLIAKYMAGDILDEDPVHTHELYSSKGLRPAHYISNPTGEEEINDSISWSGMQSIFKRRGTFYTGSLASELKHSTTSMWLYFATKNSQSIMYGYGNSSIQYVCAEPTENKNYFVVTSSQANNIDLLQCVSIGDNGTSTAPDRNVGACHNIAYDVRVIKKETLESGNVAIYVNHAPFTTTATSFISSFHEVSGYSDYVLGRNGSPVSNTNGRHGMVLDGIELMVGGYETLGNIIYNATSDPLVKDMVMTNDATKLSTNVTTFINNAITLPIQSKVTTNGAWNYVTEVKLDLENGVSINTESGSSGSSTSVGYADSQYFDAITSGQREVLSLGYLGRGSAAGLRCVNGYNGVTNAYWHVLARLSINAVGGELRSEAMTLEL